MKKIKELINLTIANVFGLKHEIDSKIYRRFIYVYYNHLARHNSIQYIDGIRVFKHKDDIIVEILTQRPGILIGKGGQDINLFKSKLIEEFGKNISIDLKEHKIWSNLY